MEFDLSVLFTNNGSVVHIQNADELEEFANCLAKSGHKPIDIDIYRPEARDGDLAFRLYKSGGTPVRLNWVWSRLSAYTSGVHKIYTLNDLRRQMCTDLGELSGDIQLADLFE